jgi:hypothetical protein
VAQATDHGTVEIGPGDVTTNLPYTADAHLVGDLSA